MRFLTCSRKGGGDVKIKKAFLTKCSNLVFSVMACNGSSGNDICKLPVFR